MKFGTGFSSNFKGFFLTFQVGISLDETVTRADLKDLLWVFAVPKTLDEVIYILTRTYGSGFTWVSDIPKTLCSVGDLLPSWGGGQISYLPSYSGKNRGPILSVGLGCSRA